MYKIINQAAGGLEILLYSLIEGGYSASSIISQLKSRPDLKNVILRINSDGGDYFEALALYNYLKAMNTEITVHVDGVAASAASIVMCAGRVVMNKGAMIMLHNPSGQAMGDSAEIAGAAAVLDKVKESIISVYQEKTGLDAEVLAEMMTAETWLDAEHAAELHFADEIAQDSMTDSAPELPAVPMPETAEREGGASSELISRAVRNERKRLQELDALMTPARREIINKAKYETFSTARDIAFELLKLQARAQDSSELSDITPDYGIGGRTKGGRITPDKVAGIINSRRGWKK